MIINIKNLEKVYGDKVIFENAKLQINEKDRLALLGQNGAGKTTLFRCISGDEDFGGSIVVTSGTNISLMEQEKVFEKQNMTFMDYIKKKDEAIESKRKILEDKMGEPNFYENELNYSRVMAEYELLCSRVVESIEFVELKFILSSLGFSLDLLEKNITTLSGGERTALRLAECLGRKADVLMLDEPTNHLDLRAINWLEKHVKGLDKTVIVVSHDRYFIDRIVNKVVEIENKGLKVYTTNYSNYLIERVAHREALKVEHEMLTAKKGRLMASSLEKRMWAHKNANKGLRIMADRLERQADELPKTIDPDSFEDRYKFSIKSGKRSGKMVYDVNGISKSYDDKVLFENGNFLISSGERIGIFGKNGAGKSTLLKILNKMVMPDDGVIREGMNLEVGYFDQEGDNLPKNLSVMEFLRDTNPYLEDWDVIALAKKFGLTHDLPKKKIKLLSGGEKVRLQLISIITSGFNVLLLDEPTNHLDIELRESLEKALREFTGTVIFVSHDRFFMDNVADKMLIVDDGKIKLEKGNYSDVFK